MTDDTTTDPNPNDEYTQSNDTRWTGTGTVLALVLVTSVPVIVGLAAAGVLSLAAVPQATFLLYATLALMAGVWTFGDETLKAVRRARGKDVPEATNNN